jgi:hypothetical protein
MISFSKVSGFLLILIPFILIQDVYSNSVNYPLVFVSRNPSSNGNILFPSAGLLPGMGSHSRFKVVGGKLIIRESNGNLITLIDSTKSFNGVSLVDIQQPCVHWNGSKILFSGIEHRDSNWRIYEIKKDGSGFKKLTFTNRNINLSQFGNAAYKFQKYDDIDPIYLSDGKIIFSSTRFPTLSMMGVQATNLFIMDSTGNSMFRVTTERNGAEKPTIDPLGRVVYSRWWLNIDRPSNLTASGITRVDSLALTEDIANIWQTNVIKPDGDALALYAGDPRSRLGFHSYRPRIMNNGDMLAVFNRQTSMFETGGSTGIVLFNEGFSTANYIVGVNPSTPLYSNNPPSYGTYVAPHATDPVPLPDGRILFSYATSVIDQDYGIYAINPDGSGFTQVFDLPSTLELNAEILLPRKTPPLVEYLPSFDTNKVPPTSNASTFYQGGLFRFDCLNIYANAPVDAPIDDAPPITKNAKLRFFLNFQREDENGRDHPILFRDIVVEYDGKIAEGDIPANVSMFEQVTDSTGNIIVNSKGNIAHVSGMNFGIDGSGTKCVGCHAGHTMIEVPINLYEGQFTNYSTSAEVRQSSYRFDNEKNNYPGQRVVDRKARNSDLQVNWVSTGGTGEYVILKWEIPIEVRRFVMYDVFPNPSNGTTSHVTDSEIFLYYEGSVVKHIPSTGELHYEGKTVPVSPITKIDSAKFVIKNFTGTIDNQNVAGLAEIEVNARISPYQTTNIKNNISAGLSYRLEQNYPNPFNPSTTIFFTIPRTENVVLEVFDITGRVVALLINGRVEAGENSIVFNASSLSSGIYFYRLKAGDFVKANKMLLLK